MGDDQQVADLLGEHLSADPANASLLWSDPSRARAVVADIAPGDPALRNAMAALTSFNLARTLGSGMASVEMLRSLISRLESEQGIRLDVAERAVAVVTAAFQPQLVRDVVSRLRSTDPHPKAVPDPQPNVALPPHVPHRLSRPVVIVGAVLVLLCGLGIAAYAGHRGGTPGVTKGLSAAEKALVHRLPASLVDTATCRSTDSKISGQVASVACDLAPGVNSGTPEAVSNSSVYVDQYSSAAELRKSMDVRNKTPATRSGTNCSSPQETWTGDGVSQGEIYCRSFGGETDPFYFYTWTYSRSLIDVSVVGHDLAGLDTWWKALPDLALRLPGGA